MNQIPEHGEGGDVALSLDTADRVGGAQVLDRLRRGSRRTLRAGWRYATTVLVWQLLLVASFIALWEAATRNGVIDPFWVSRPSEVWDKLYEWTSDGTLLEHAPTTFFEALLGLALGALTGVPIGFMTAMLPRVDRVITPLIALLNSIPRIALAPLFILWFGLGMASKVVLAATLVFFILFVNTYAGARSISPELLTLMKVLGASPFKRWQKVMLPHTVVWIIAALRLGLGLAILGAVVGELIGSTKGLGYLAARATGVFDIAGLLAALLVLGVGSMIIDRIAVMIHQLLMPWEDPGRNNKSGNSALQR